MSYRILVINPGSTSTKIGVYEDEQLLFDKTLRHSAEEVAQFNSIAAQKDWRRDLVMRALREQGIDARTLSAVSGRGGLLRPIRGGTYNVGSISKVYCAVAVMQLVERGLLELDRPVCEYLPRFWMPDERYKKITLRHCLSHSCGLPGTQWRWLAASRPRRDEDYYEEVYRFLAHSALHSEPGEGFVFGLFSERDIHENGVTLLADTLVAVGMTDENGRLTFDGTFPHGDYYVRELQAKTGWKLNPNRFPITLEPGSDAVIRVELAQPIYDELVYTPVTLTKTDITGAKTVPGAQIEVRNEQSEMIYRATTDANGEIPDIPVTPGTYAFREILAPSGYALNEAETRFTVDEQGNVTGNTMLRDDYTRVQLRKQDENGVPLSGVEFALVTETGTRLMTAVSDANGLVTFEKIPYGRYTVEETQPLPGYFKAAVHVRLTVDGAFINPNEPLETVTNTPMRLAYKKVDTSGRPLAGVEFSLINAATNVVTEVAASDENGEFIFRHIDYGDWIIRETAAPNGYRRMEDMLLHIGEDFVQPEPITLVNVPNSYMFMKMDGDGNPLSGVKFVLEDADGNVLREMESGEDGTVLLENLEDGRYVIRETEALQGYAKTEDTLTFTIDESYVVPEEMPCLVNKKEDEKHDIQTGVDIELTPMMTEGAALLLLAGIILIGRRLADRKRRKK